MIPSAFVCFSFLFFFAPIEHDVGRNVRSVNCLTLWRLAESVKDSVGTLELEFRVLVKTRMEEMDRFCARLTTAIRWVNAVPMRSALCRLIRQLYTQPRSLKQMCRVTIYNASGRCSALSVNKLPLPGPLKEYLLNFDPWTSSSSTTPSAASRRPADRRHHPTATRKKNQHLIHSTIHVFESCNGDSMQIGLVFDTIFFPWKFRWVGGVGGWIRPAAHRDV